MGLSTVDGYSSPFTDVSRMPQNNGTSWDAVFDDYEVENNDDTGKKECHQENSHRYHSKLKSRNIILDGQLNHKAMSSAMITPSPSSKTKIIRGSRVARLASLFSSRVVVTTSESTPPLSPSPSPLSPSRSVSSTDYVGWPGTQDKQGVTVVAETSFEESDVNVRQIEGYQREMEQNAEKEILRWCDDDSEVISISENSNSPVKSFRLGTQLDRDIIEDEHLTPDNAIRTTVARFDSKAGAKVKNIAEGKISTEHWDDTLSDLSTSYSKTSSAYLNPKEVQAIQDTKQLFGINKNRLVAATVMRRCLSSSGKARQSKIQQQHKQPLQSLTEETLAMKDHFSPPARNFNTVGFRGLLDRTQDVPNLMDETQSESTSVLSASTSRRSSVFDQGPAGRYGCYTGNEESSKLDQDSSSSSCSPLPPSIYNRRNQRRKQNRQQHVTIIEENCNKIDVESDVFDGISNKSHQQNINTGTLERATTRASMDKINLALLGGGLTAIQTTTGDFTNRKTASDFDETLTNSDYDQYGFAKIPAFHEMAVAGMSHHDRSISSQSLSFSILTSPKKTKHRSQNQNNRVPKEDSDGNGSDDELHTWDHHLSIKSSPERINDFSDYYVPPQDMQILVKKFRKISQTRFPRLGYEDLEKEEDSTKAFALSEMRSRIMEKDIERGLERRGGTTVVDDIVMTSYNKAALRVRDAVIVAKAWRDGVLPQDIINTSNLTRRTERCYCIPRLEMTSRGASKYTWEEVNWIDDNELSRFRCHSIGPRHLKGVEMFTIGDCQSILLKLCNDRCQELRDELNDATAEQIEAEGLMKEEGDIEICDGMMTESEMLYLTSMEAVKSLSQKLVLAEKAFNLVKNRIEKLVAKYETLLVRFENENESVASSSVFSCDSSAYTEDYFVAGAKEHEKKVLARRAQRVELHAEVAARESLLGQDVKATHREEKELQLNNLKVRLADLQSESSAAFTEKDHSIILARAITRTNHSNKRSSDGVDRGIGGRTNDRLKIDNIKQRFRRRSAAKFQFNSSKRSNDAQNHALSNSNNNGNSFYRTVGEEMFQHLDFYERSLKAVEPSE